MRNRRRNGTKAFFLPLFKGEGVAVGEIRGIGAKNPLPSPIQCRQDTTGHALTDGTCPARQDGTWSDGTWPGYDPPLPHTGREKQGATARRWLSVCRQSKRFLQWQPRSDQRERSSPLWRDMERLIRLIRLISIFENIRIYNCI